MSDIANLERFRRLDDEQLIRLDAELAPGALEVLYERHHVRAFSFAARIVGSRDRAQDVVQEAFLTLWREAGRYDPTRGPVRTWLMSMVHDRGIDCVRRLSVRERMQADATGSPTPLAETDIASGQGNPPDDVRAVRAALQALPEEERQIIELAFYDGWTQGEIADILKQPLDTVRSHARLGLIKLRAALLSEASP